MLRENLLAEQCLLVRLYYRMNRTTWLDWKQQSLGRCAADLNPLSPAVQPAFNPPHLSSLYIISFSTRELREPVQKALIAESTEERFGSFSVPKNVWAPQFGSLCQ